MRLTAGMKVVKPKGYPFPGTVVATFTTLAGNPRVVVESEAAPGLLHIYAPTQLEPATQEQLCPWCSHAWKYHRDDYQHFRAACLYGVGLGEQCGCERRQK